MFRNFQGNIWRDSFIVKQFSFLFIEKAWNSTKKTNKKKTVKIYSSEAAFRRRFIEKVFLKISEDSEITMQLSLLH